MAGHGAWLAVLFFVRIEMVFRSPFKTFKDGAILAESGREFQRFQVEAEQKMTCHTMKSWFEEQKSCRFQMILMFRYTFPRLA